MTVWPEIYHARTWQKATGMRLDASPLYSLYHLQGKTRMALWPELYNAENKSKV